MMRAITTDRFSCDILLSEKPIIALFEASWCPFCRAFKPVMQRSEDDLPWPIVAVLLDDMDDSLWDRYEIEVVPTIMVFKGGEIVFRANGTLGVGLDASDISRLKAFVRGRGGDG